jgi:type I restriction enzyme, S subunit
MTASSQLVRDETAVAWREDTLANLGGKVTSGSRGWAKHYAEHGDLFVRITNLRRSSIYLDLSNCRYVRPPEHEAEAQRTRLAIGDVLVSITADIGIVGYVHEEVPQPAYINQHIARVRFEGSRVDSQFVAYYLASWKPQRLFVGSTDTGAKAGMNLQTVVNLRTLVPPREEQRRIARVLGDVDQLIAKTEQLIAKKQAIRQGMMQELLTGKTRLPGFDHPWKEVRLGDHVTYVKTVALSRAQLDSHSPLRYLHYGDIHTTTCVTLDAANVDMPRAPLCLTANAGRLQVGDLVFADASEDTAGVGRSVEITSVPEGGLVPGLHTIAARFDPAILAEGFKAYLQFHPAFRASLLRLAAGTKVLATTRSYISSIRLHLPDVTEQRAIAELLRDADTEIERLAARLAKARDIKQGMTQELLTGRTRLPVEVTS